jgi:hypothetical protein
MNWEDKSNNEIMATQVQMNEEFEAKKQEIAVLATRINKLMKDLDELDAKYLESKKVLDARLSYSR